MPASVFSQITAFPFAFWVLIAMEMLERLAYYGVRTVIPVYIAHADEPGGLHFTSTQKGTIFMGWAVVQSLLPMFSGGFADRYGYKRTIALSVLVKTAGYGIMATQRDYAGFFAGCLVLAAGTALFKPGIQGSLVLKLTPETSSIGWGLFYQTVNIGGFLGPPLAFLMREHLSWQWVFYACAIVVSLNLLLLVSYTDPHTPVADGRGPWAVLRDTLNDFLNPRLLVFTLVMSGFWLMFNQLFDMLPNFIVDWVDSRSIVNGVRAVLPAGAADAVLAMVSSEDAMGRRITQEWMINLNPGLIILLVVPISWLVARVSRLTSITVGIVVASMGLVAAGYTMSGVACLAGILLFSVGEMLASPKMNEYLGVIAPPGKAGLYMGYANVPLAVGWGYGSFWGGYLYEAQAEKASLALRHLETLGGAAGVTRETAFRTLCERLSLDAPAATRLLWDAYDPAQVWFPFAAVGLASAVGMVLYARWVAGDGRADA